MNIKRIDRKSCERLWGDGSILPSVSSDLSSDEINVRLSCEQFLDSIKSQLEYEVDKSLSLELYFNILPLDNKFSLREAADNSIWSRLTVQVMPDLVVRRWPPNAGLHSKDHFWGKPQRNWFKSLWWYAHLSSQGNDKSATERCLAKGSTDAIQAIVERPGPGGFRVDLFRELMRRLGDGSFSVSRLKQLLKLNTSRVCLVEPELYDGGISGYVDSLIHSIP
jgi:hypothetical protein